MKNLKVFIFFLMVFLCVSMAMGANFKIEMSPVSEDSGKIYKDEVAEFQVTITNLIDKEDKYLVYSLNPSWIISTDEPALKVESGKSKTFVVYIDPTSSVTNSGIYSLKIDVKSVSSGNVLSSNQELIIKSDSYRTFIPAISVIPTVDFDNVVDLRDKFDVKIRLVNRNALDIPKLTVFVESSLFQDSYETAISPNSEMIKLLTYNVDPYTPPRTDVLKVQVYYDGEMITDKRIEYEIQENKLFFTREVKEANKFLYSKYLVTLQNLGNVKSSEKFSYKLSSFKNKFTTTNPVANFIKSEPVSSLEFNVELEPSEILEVEIVTDYRAFVYTTSSIIFLALLILFLYFTLRSPVVVTKKATVVSEKDGGTSEIKILLNLKNRTNKLLENITVIDRIPDITEIEEEFSLGTLKPTKIVRNSKKGTLIRWDFPNVEGFEERLITYRIHSKLGILGSFSLPAAMVRFEQPNGKKRAVKSKAVEKA